MERSKRVPIHRWHTFNVGKAYFDRLEEEYMWKERKMWILLLMKAAFTIALALGYAYILMQFVWGVNFQ